MLFGIVLAIVSAILFNTGFVIEKRALHRMPEVHADRTVHMVRTLIGTPLWLGGFALSLLGIGVNVLALSRAPLSVVQPVVAAGIVWLLLLSHFSLKEHLGRIEWVGMAIVFTALVCIGVSLDKKAERLGTSGTTLRVLAVAIPSAALSAAVYVAAGRRERGSAPLLGIAAGLDCGIGGLAVKGLGVLVEDNGLFGAVGRSFVSADLYILGAFAGAGLLMFQTALQRGRASVVVPITNVMSTAYPIVVGMAVFGEHLPHALWRVGLRFAGLAGVLVGTVFLAGGRSLQAAYAVDEEEDADIDLELRAAASAS